MRIASYESSEGSSFGLISERGVIDAGRRTGLKSLKQWLERGQAPDLQVFASFGIDYSLSEIRFLQVIPDPEQLFCVGANYREHVQESRDLGIDRPVPKAPALFTRVPQSLVGHLEPILRPSVSNDLDYECELAVIIGRAGRYITKADALSHVAGYSCFNDGSIRDWQFHTTQILSGKNFPCTGGFGPWLTRADEIPDPQHLNIQTRLNGVVLQKANTRDMIFDIAAILVYVSSMLELRPGDIVATGTCAGVGMARKPQIWMKPGDVCEVEIEKVGVLTNNVSQEQSQ
jgi:2-keto-4-pentenoate hydratase/2-oxohepta-3-ene-1,7-dioic acid hydratase in catechol pathway